MSAVSFRLLLGSARPYARSSLWRALVFIAKTLLSLAITLLGLLVVTFVIGRVVPIDPVLSIVGDRASQSTYHQVYLELGLNKPLYVQFWIYLEKVLHGNFGTSVLTGNPVIDDIQQTFPATIELATTGIIIGTVIGVPIGVLAAARQGQLSDQIVRIVGLVGYSAPIFWLGLLALLVFYAILGWAPGPGRLDISYQYIVTPETNLILVDSALQGQWGVFRNALSHLALPGGLLGYYSMAYISRMTRSFMLNELSQEYITAARIKGLSGWRIIWGHALRNAAVPLLTVIALSYANLLEGSVVTETVFAWPGLGQYLTNALENADMNAVLGATFVIGSVFVAINLLSDLLYKLLDPRVKDTL